MKKINLIWIIAILVFPFVHAGNVTEIGGGTFTQTSVPAAITGFTVKANYNVTVLQITKSGATTATHINITNMSKKSMGMSEFVGNDATFKVNLTAGELYYFGVHNAAQATDSQTFTSNNTATYGYPDLHTMIDLRSGHVNWNNLTIPAYGWDIVSWVVINTSEAYPPPVTDTTPPVINGTINNTSPQKNQIINATFNLTDDTALNNGYITINDTGTTRTFNFALSGTTAQISQNFTVSCVRGCVINITGAANDTSANLKYNTTIITVANTPVPAPTSVNWLTTGGFTSGTRVYNEIIDYVNATCTADADNDFSSCNLTVTDPDGNIVVNNATMSIVTGSVYSYTTDFTLNKAGTWSFTVSAADSESISTASTSVTVQTQNLTIIDGWYGYTEDNLFSESLISNLTLFDYTLLEFTINASRLSQDFEKLLNLTNKSQASNLKVGINILLDFNYSVAGEKNRFYSNITANFTKLKEIPYVDALKYISLELYNQSKFSNGDLFGVLNNASINITSTTSNKFVVYTKTPIAGLDTSYITNTTLRYITAQTHSQWIDDERGYMRNSSTLNRIYKVNGSLKDTIDNFHDNIFDVMRGTPVTTTTVGNKTVAEISNGDFIVFNNQSSNLLFYINFSNVSGVLGKDLWDFTNKIFVHPNTNGTANINISGYSATMIFVEDFDHVEYGWTLFKATSSGEKTFNYTDDTNDGNFALDNDADEFRIELFDPHYSHNSFITYYGWINASYISNWSAYQIVILDDENTQVVDRVLANATNTDFYFYISVADYANTQAWCNSKKTEVDNIIALNDSTKINVFVDGLDSGIGGVNFSNKFKDCIVDYTKVTKNRKIGLNTYTAYQQFCSWAEPDGFCMKESCVRRWNGSDASNPTAYDWENWDLELNKSRWYNEHNVRVLCQAFDNRTTDTFEPTNWTTIQDTYFASLVLGYTDFYISQPDFNYAHSLYHYNAGTQLANSWSTDDNQTYFRRYSNGIVYFNSSSHHGWINDGRGQDVQACFKLYDNSDGAGDEERDFVFRINNVSTTDVNQYTILATSITAGVWNWYCVDLNETHESTNGVYQIEGSTTNSGQVADGIYIGWENVQYTGIHSWYSTTAGDPVWTFYPQNQNWEVKIIVNETKKASVDSFSGINQTTTDVSGKTNLTLFSNTPFDLEVWSNGITVSRFLNLTYYNGTDFVKMHPINTSTCNSNNPSYNSTTINGEIHKSCIETIGTNTYVKVATPHLSTQTYQISTNALPIVTIVQPVENTLYNIQPLGINYTITDANNDAITQINIYINGTLNQTLTSVTNTTLNASDGKYNISISAFDGTDWGTNATISSFKIDTVNPLISGVSVNNTFNNSNFNVTVTITDNNLYGANCTIYNGSSTLSFILFSQEYTNIATTSQTIILEYNTTWGDGSKFTRCMASDDHTKKQLSDISYDINHGALSRLLGKKDGVNFKKGTELKEDVSIYCDENSDDIKVYKLDDRYSMLFDFSASKTKGNLNTYNCHLKTSSKITFRPQSKYKGHFVLGNGIGDTFVDYVFANNSDANYTVVQESGGYKVTIITRENLLNFSSIGGVNTLEVNTTIIMDTVLPTFSDAFNRTADSSNSTSITTNTDANLSLFGVADTNFNYTLFSSNASSGVWANTSVSFSANGTHHYILSRSSFSSGQVVGWKSYIFDKAENVRDTSVYTFTVGNPPLSPSPSSSGGGSSGSSITIPQELASDPFGSEPTLSPVGVQQCKEGYQLFDGRCYACDPKIGYLEFNPNDRSVLCRTCNEGYHMVNKKCEKLPPGKINVRINSGIDKAAKMIANAFKSDNLLIGYIVLGLMFGLTSTSIYNYLTRSKK